MYTYICMYIVCVYVYIYIYIYIHRHTYNQAAIDDETCIRWQCNYVSDGHTLRTEAANVSDGNAMRKWNRCQTETTDVSDENSG